MSTPFINEKINILQQQIQNEETALFQHELTVADFDPSAKTADASDEDKAVANALSATAKGAAQQAAVCRRRLAVRRSKLAELEAERDAAK